MAITEFRAGEKKRIANLVKETEGIAKDAEMEFDKIKPDIIDLNKKIGLIHGRKNIDHVAIEDRINRIQDKMAVLKDLMRDFRKAPSDESVEDEHDIITTCGN